MTTQYDIIKLVETDIRETILAEIVDDVLRKDPFVFVPGLLNIRDVGANASALRSGLIYRSGTLHNLSDDSKKKLANDLRIKLLVDLRSPGEVTRSPDPQIEGIKNVHFDSLNPPTPIDLEKFKENGGVNGYVDIYSEVLDIHRPSIKAVLEHLRDEGTPVLFHCTAGKDRTGVLAALLLALADAPMEIIAHDYMLTRLGIEPFKETLTQMLKLWNKDWSYDTPGMNEFSQVRGEFILGMLGKVDEQYGGVEGYVKSMGFSEEDIVRIKAVLKEN